MALPERIFVIAVESEAGRDPDRMNLLARVKTDGGRLTPVFSSMLLATAFLNGAQQLGHFVKLDFIFPLDGLRFEQDFAEYSAALDPSPQAFFPPAPQPP